MRRVVVVAASLVAVLSLAVMSFAFAQSASATPAPNASQGFARSCGAVTGEFARCHAIVNLNKVSPNASSPSGYGPSDLQSAYNLASAAAASGGGVTIAIVDAYNDPQLGYAGDDLDVYRSQYGLPAVSHPANCPVAAGTAGPWFCKVNQSGTTSKYPRNNGGWAQEESLDVDMVSAICPNCNILLVEASSNSYVNLGTAVNEAATLGAAAISNSYGGSESSGETSYDSYYNHPGIAVTASSGDGGYGVEFPAASPYVTAVGGTSLTRASNTRGWTESVWSTSNTEGAGSGCSAYESQPGWQNIANITGTAAVGSTTEGNCARRAVADVSADADPSTGVSVYDSYSYQGLSGWLVFGGTSVASPIIASVYGLAGNASSVNYGSYPYSHTSSLYDVTSGSTSNCGSDLCTAAPGWDGPTGLGTPNGTGGF
jgi:subtilase family serine protease